MFPRQGDIKSYVRWYNEGPGMFTESEKSRRLSTIALGELIRRLGMHPRYERMRSEILAQGRGRECRGERFGQGPRDELRDALLRTLRYHGYVYRDRDTGALAVVPMTGVQIYLTRRLADGSTTAEIASDLGYAVNSISGRVRTAYQELGCATTYQVIGCVYRHGWFPDAREIRYLLSLCPRGEVMPAGYITRGPE